MSKIEEHLVKLQMTMTSTFVGPLNNRLNDWLVQLQRLKTCLQHYKKVKCQWKRKKIQDFRVNIQANSNRTPSFHSYRFIQLHA